MKTKQNQKSGDSSTNVQARDIVVYQGVTYSEVRQAALDVFQSNFYELAGKAREIAASRGEAVTEKFLQQLQRENPAGFAKSGDPDFQHALFTVQKEYARSGDEDLGALLVDLLVDRSKREGRDILQIVLNESLATAPKLTNDQLAVLAVIFLFRYTQNLGIGKLEVLGDFLDMHAAPFADKLRKSDSCYRHLEFCGCGSITMGHVLLEQMIGIIYQGLFLSGFDASEISTRGISIGQDSRLFVPCLNDPAKVQVKAVNKQTLDENLNKYAIGEDDRTKIRALFDHGKMSGGDIKAKVIALRPYMGQVFDAWTSSDMKSFTLTSVGMAIGHANVKRLVGEFSDLSIWIN